MPGRQDGQGQRDLPVIVQLLSLCLVAANPGDSAINQNVGQPSLALLEFLGSFEDSDDQWVDPFGLPVELDRNEPIDIVEGVSEQLGEEPINDTNDETNEPK